MSQSNQNERSPLISNEHQSGDHFPSAPLSGDFYITTTGPVDSELPPPPYTPRGSTVPVINCRVCGLALDLTGRQDQHVVKCYSCNEATPIKTAPPGKRYVRCACNCLLLCKSSSQRVACPRENCKRIITIAPVQPVPPGGIPVYGMCQVSCAYCTEIFLYNASQKALARCPHCRKISSISQEYVRIRGLCLLLFFCICLMALVALLVRSLLHYNNLFIIGYVAFIVLTLISLYYCLYFCTMKVSTIETPA